MEIVSALVSGVLGILATLLGFVLGLAAGLIAWWWKARGIREMLADEVETNRAALEGWKKGDPWPVRSVYIWQSLQSLVPGVLSRKRVKALAQFYYRQAEVYRERECGRPLTEDQARNLQCVAVETLKMLGRASNKPLQPTRAAQPNGRREAPRVGPRG